MIIRPRDTVKLFGILIMIVCAVFVSTLFMNSNMDMAKIKDKITDPEALVYYDTIVTSGNMTTAIAGGALLLTTVVMLVFYIKHTIDTRRADLGILKAMGVSNGKLALQFWVFGVSIFTGAVIGFAGAWAFMPAFYADMRRTDVLPEIPMEFNPILLVLLILVPALLFSLLSVLYASRKLKRPALELIRGTEPNLRVKTQKNGKDLPFLRELRRGTVRSRKILTFFIAFAAFCHSAMTQMSMSMKDLSSEMMGAMILIIGLTLAFTTLFIAITTVIRGNTKTIAMLRVFGYSDRECGYAILNGYRPAAYIGFVIGTGYQFGLIKMMVSVFFAAQETVKIPEYHFNVPVLLISLAAFVVVYEAIMLVYAARMKRVPLKEVMMES